MRPCGKDNRSVMTEEILVFLIDLAFVPICLKHRALEIVRDDCRGRYSEEQWGISVGGEKVLFLL